MYSGVYGGVEGPGHFWLFWAEVPMLCIGSCWSENGSSLWSGISDICGEVVSVGWGVTVSVGVMVEVVMGVSISQRVA